MTDKETIEEIVESIQSGRVDLLPILWEHVERIATSAVWKIWKSNAGVQAGAKAKGIDVDDLLQESYFAFLEAVEQHDATNGWSFTTRLWVCTADKVHSLTERRSGDQNESTEKAIAGEDGALTIGATIKDEKAEAAFESIVQTEYWASVRDDLEHCVDELPANMSSLIRWCYFDEKNAKDWAQQTGVSEYAAGRLRKKALALLSKAERLQEYRQDIIERYSYRGQVVQAVIKLDELDRRTAREVIENSWKAALLDSMGGTS